MSNYKIILTFNGVYYKGHNKEIAKILLHLNENI